MGHFLHCAYYYLEVVAFLLNKMPAFTNPWFFLRTPELQLINFVRRKGQVCIFVILKKPCILFPSRKLCIGRESLLLWNKSNPLLWSTPLTDDYKDWTERLCLTVWQKCQTKADCCTNGTATLTISFFYLDLHILD